MSVFEKKIYRYTLHDSNQFGHGGEKRTAQISDLLDGNQFSNTILPKPSTKIIFSFRFMHGFLQSCILYIQVLIIIKTIPSPRKLITTILWATNRLTAYKDIESDGLLFWEATRIEHAYCLPFFKKRGFRIIAFPQNLESLVPSQKSALSGKEAPYWLMEEVLILRECDMVVAISKEETLFLKQCGINAMYLPYYPSQDVVASMQNIREERKKLIVEYSTKKKILMLGSANNPPTKLGMIDRINFFASNPEINCEVIIAGYYTELLKTYIKGTTNISVLGELTNNQLSDLLAKIDFVLIHQPPTSGALMRITELLIAGVPVVANFVSARNYFGTKGIYIYEDNIELIQLINQNLDESPMLNKPSYNQIVNSIFNL